MRKPEGGSRLKRQRRNRGKGKGEENSGEAAADSGSKVLSSEFTVLSFARWIGNNMRKPEGSSRLKGKGETEAKAEAEEKKIVVSGSG